MGRHLNHLNQYTFTVMPINKVWHANSNSLWIRTLLRIYNKDNHSYDKDCINYWRTRFHGEIYYHGPLILLRKNLMVIDGNHRLIAMYLESLKKVRVKLINGD